MNHYKILMGTLASSFFVSSCVDMNLAESNEDLAGKYWICEEGRQNPNCANQMIGDPSTIAQGPIIDDFAESDTISLWGGKWYPSPSASEDNYQYAYLTYTIDYYQTQSQYLQVYANGYNYTAAGNPPVGARLYLSSNKKYVKLTCDTIQYSYRSSLSHRFQLESEGVEWTNAYGQTFPASSGAWSIAQIVPSSLTPYNGSTNDLDLGKIRTMGWMLAGSGNLDLDSIICIQNQESSSSSSVISSSSSDMFSSGAESSSSSVVTGRVGTDLTGDTNTYAWVSIEGQKWLSDNINYGAFQSSALTQEANTRYCYQDVEENCHNGFGGYYTWATALSLIADCNNLSGCTTTSNVRGVCPTGWRIPTLFEWTTLLNHSATALKSTDTWLSGAGQDSLGLDIEATGMSSYSTALPNYVFNNYGSRATFWAADEYSASAGYLITFSSYDNVASIAPVSKMIAAQIRCVEN